MGKRALLLLAVLVTSGSSINPAKAATADSYSGGFLDSTTSTYIAGLHDAVTNEVDVGVIIGGQPVLRWDWNLVRPTSGYSGLFTSNGGRAGVTGKVREYFSLNDAIANTDVDITFGIVDVSSYPAGVAALTAEAKAMGVSRPTISSTKTSTWISTTVRNSDYQSIDTLVGLVVKRGKRGMILFSVCYRYEASRTGNRCTVKQLEGAVSTIAFNLPPFKEPVTSDHLDLPVSLPRSVKPVSATPTSTYDLLDLLDPSEELAKSFGSELPPLVEPYGWTATTTTFHVVGHKRLSVRMVTIPVGSNPSPTSMTKDICMDALTGKDMEGCTSSALEPLPSVLAGQVSHSRKTDNPFEIYETQAVMANRFISVACGREDYLLLTKNEQSACRSASKDLIASLASK
jgi:hypothetical protein